MGLSVFQNLAGTLLSTFRLGRRGPTLRQGTVDPNVDGVEGNDGDVYIQYGDVQQFFQQRLGVWYPIGQEGNGFSRKVITSPSYAVQPTDHYLGVNYSGPVTITLPPGLVHKTYIIKDETGQASDLTPITILAHTGETIDGDPEVIVRGGYTSLTLVFGGEWHII